LQHIRLHVSAVTVYIWHTTNMGRKGACLPPPSGGLSTHPSVLIAALEALMAGPIVQAIRL